MNETRNASCNGTRRRRRMCRREMDSGFCRNAGDANAGSGIGPRFRNNRKPGMSGMRNRFAGRNRAGGR